MTESTEAQEDGIILTIPDALPTLNDIRGMHYHEYKKLREWLAWEIRAQYRHDGDPIKLCLIFVERYGSGKTPDWDNLYGGFKPLGDCLSKYHEKLNPNGLGIIYDDSPDYVKSLNMIPIKAKRSEEKTVITIVDVNK
ncbi:MAG: hypothetical protein OES84_00220 [Kiritimatiellaceae bacterium]|nr:hypothetical protein [Kiritimatiellaceae bacterium]